MIDRQNLLILREVHRLGSVTAAAERLNLSQSALSHMVRRFEERYGITIWTKKGRGMQFTQAGTYLLGLAERVLPQIDHAERMLADYAAGRRGALRIGMECHPCQNWLMRVTAPYLAAWPDVEFDIRTEFRFDGIDALLANEIDLLITPDPTKTLGILYIPAFDYELVLAVHRDHPLAAVGVAAPSDLVNEELLTYPVDLARLDIFTRFLIPANCRPRRHKTVETTDIMLQLVAAGRGVSSIPDWLMRDEASKMPIRSVRLGVGIHKSISMGIRVGEENVGYIAGFVKSALEISS